MSVLDIKAMLNRTWRNPTGETIGPLDLLVLQATPFCNLDCDYCYLPNRSSTLKMPLSVLEKTLSRVFESDIVQNDFTIVWHAGEPTVPSIDYYHDALKLIAMMTPPDIEISHSFQTNAVLVNDDWCRFFKDHQIKVGVSVDGPAFLHDQHRKTKNGQPTHHLVQRGMDRLRANGVPFHTISVLTGTAIQYPKEIFEFFLGNGIRQCCFNIEETEGIHQQQTLKADDIKNQVSGFFREFLLLNAKQGFPLQVRELDGAKTNILEWKKEDANLVSSGQELVPYRIMTVDCEGDFSTFSPELIGTLMPSGQPFVFGNVFESSIRESIETEWFKQNYRSVHAGITKCRNTCEYYSLCGGGSPSNKYFEHGSFESAETLSCQLNKQSPLDVALEFLENQANSEQQKSTKQML